MKFALTTIAYLLLTFYSRNLEAADESNTTTKATNVSSVNEYRGDITSGEEFYVIKPKQMEPEGKFELSLIDQLFKQQTLIEAVYDFACQMNDEKSGLFVEPATCLDNEFTHDSCLNNTCCYAISQKTGMPICVKQQSRAYIFSKLEHFHLIDFDIDGVDKKKSIEDFINTLVSCVKRGERNCKRLVEEPLRTDLLKILNGAVSGTDPGAIQLIQKGGIPFVQALRESELISTNNQYERLKEIAMQGTAQPMPVIPFIPTARPTFIEPPIQPTIFPAFPHFKTTTASIFFPPGQECFWYPWGSWSECTGQCGVALQSRTRSCQGCLPGTGACQGESCMKRSCVNPIRQICGYWSSWSPYGPCSSTCGMGTMTRTRQCYGTQVGMTGCIGESTQSMSCNTDMSAIGQYMPWTMWTACTVSCGGGTQSRQQMHTCGLPTNNEVKDCNTFACCYKLPWSPWTACSTSCGLGIQTRSRRDICPQVPEETETTTCNLGSGNYGDWSPWGGCSQTCPGGVQIRQRGHSCSNTVDSENRPCGNPGEFSPWTAFGTCSSSCPGGTATRTRRHTCTNEMQSDSMTCGRQPGFSPWGEYSACSSTCSGTRTRRQFNPCGGPPNIENQKCGSNEYWSEWGRWGLCSQSCLGGTQIRTRIQPCTGKSDQQTQPCGSRGTWGVYSSWSACDRSCGPGNRFRTRIHSCPALLSQVEKQSERAVEPCNLRMCCEFGDWSPWTACLQTCGYGISSQHQMNSCTNIPKRARRKFCLVSHGEWATWSPWGACSQSCPGGQAIRTRKHTCTGRVQNQAEMCGKDPGFSPWGEWSACTKSCGGGTQFRTRTNACGIGMPERENRQCNTNPGVYRDPTPWSECSSTCAGGFQVRTYSHSCGLPDRTERKTCGNPGTFLPWGNWGPCSSSCIGTKSRFQRHQCTNEMQEDTKPCGEGGAFGPWTSWTVCSQICAGGTRTRSRSHSCRAGLDTENQSCGRQPFYGEWSLWGPCSRTCGGGNQTRTRIGTCGFSDETQQRFCATSMCCYIKPWEEWSPCSVSCGMGQRSRNRYSNCAPTVAADTQTKACNAGTGFTSQWTRWSPCPVSCGGGQQSRQRTNTCEDEPEIMTRACASLPCPYWSAWSLWSECSVTCYSGTKKRERKCVFGDPNSGCSGESIQVLPCESGEGIWEPWSFWTACSASCGGGTRSRTRINSCGMTPENQMEVCNTDLGDFGPWTMWTQCSSTCGGGMRSRQRMHSCTEVTDLAQEACNNNLGMWNAWSDWSACSVTCGGGTQTRIRSHTCGLDDDFEIQPCNTYTGIYTQWSQWTLCSATCGGGSRSKTRSHTCGLPDDTQHESCSTYLCPYWSGWSEFGSCSASCGMGVRIRTRICQAGNFGAPGCIGESREETLCNAGQGVLSEWTEFTPCSATCNGGFMSRSRRNSCESTPQVETAACNTNPGHWNPWENWTRCPVTCGGGTMTRRRTHSCDGDDEFQTVPCNTDAGSWSYWTQWSTCSATCGFGITSRNRVHTCTSEKETETKSCQDHPCAIWGGWSTWGPCSTSCGKGTSTRLRQCQGGRPGEGFCFTNIVGGVDSRICDSGPCCEFDWSGWSACCRVPKAPKALQLRFLGNGCGKPWQVVNRTCLEGVKVLEHTPCTNLEELFETADSFRNLATDRSTKRFRLMEINFDY